ncbi:hypothetical protein ACM01_14860 [Streptomyces viridochromogenes]|uniref:DUF6919 domain-containing protein n=1 Tax=Streptomyces viridochromogenes TaxID=1938 RepID=A0A0J7ZEC2_STRVR|nr:hypothetical protein [Streptomyces viridochromogenes]KMS74199.1 hypothetical protein ACM01_14860 [Streptomyces viridochromogenes]
MTQSTLLPLVSAAADVRKWGRRLTRWRDAARRRRVEARIWYRARTLEELAALTARWLKGQMLWHPNGRGGGPDPETRPLIDVLAAANAAGILTENSQPGELAEFHGRPWRQRAFVTSFVADPELAQALAAQAAEAGLGVRAYRPGCRADENGERDAVDVTFWEGQGVMTGMGNRLSPRAVRHTFLGCDRQAVREVAKAWQVTLIDPEWGRDTVLWPFLTQFLNSYGPRHGTCAPACSSHPRMKEWKAGGMLCTG